MKYAAYESYKSSASEWPGLVPSHWHVDRLKWSTTGCYNGVWGDEPNDLDDLICVRVADFDRDRFVVVSNPPTIRAIEAGQRRNRILQKNDLLIEKSGGGEKQLVGCVVQFTEDFPAVCSNFVARLPVAREYDPRYLTYLHSAIYAARLNYTAIKQTTGIQNLDSGEYLNILAAYPPFDEQQTIARFLDVKTAQIDALVAQKRQFIAKLKEKRQALIARTVTRGLPPEAAKAAGLEPAPAMKDSGVEWLGQIPVHWSQVRGRFAMSVNPIARRARLLETTDEVSFVPMEAVGEYGGLDLSRTKPLDEIGAGYTAFEEGDVVVAKITPCFENGKGAIARGLKNEVGFGTTELHVLRTGKHLDKQFLFYLTTSHTFRMLGESEMYGAGGQKRVPPEFAKNFRTPLPQLEEQKAIAYFLDTETAKIDELLIQVESAITRLTEYRLALITSAVTGKIDVRGVA